MRKIIYIFIALTFLVSCDCNQNIKGTILDIKTKEPIGNVEIYNKNKSWSKTKTDEKGYFKLSNVSGGLTCPPMKIIIEHKDYEKAETEIESGGQKEILLTRKVTQKKDTLTYKQAMKNIRDIFEDYKTNEEAIESEENKTTMTKSLNSLQSVTDKNDLELLINIWNYYDPTDYSCRGEIYKILLKNKTISINAVTDRMKHRMSWESADLSGTEFKNLLEQLENEK
jgi:CarboxypepD_reg-like domain